MAPRKVRSAKPQDKEDEVADRQDEHWGLALDGSDAALLPPASAAALTRPEVLLGDGEVGPKDVLEVSAALTPKPKKNCGISGDVEPSSEAGRAEWLAWWVAGWPGVSPM